MAEDVPSRARSRWTRCSGPSIAAGIAAALWCVAWWRLSTLPEHALIGDLLVDDAYYFALPARHVWAGAGFSFDGLEPTNGVQTLWAAACVVLAGLTADPVALLRALAGLSAACWAIAALGVYRWLRPWSPGAATFAATALAFSGVTGRLAFQGMENGLHALVGVAVLFAGTRAVRSGWSPTATWALGGWLAVFGLSRTEGVLLGPIVACGAVLGPGAAGAGLGTRARRVGRLAVPGVVLVGGVALASRLAFGSWLPISGGVKAWYEAEWGGFADPALPSGGGMFASLVWHLQLVWRLAAAPLFKALPALGADALGVGGGVVRGAVWALLAVAAVAAVRRQGARGGDAPCRAGRRFAWVFGGYAVVHAVLIALLLPHFTHYATWYFATEVTAVWLLIGMALSRLGPRWQGGLAVAAVLVAIAGLRAGGGVAPSAAMNRFHAAGAWLDRHAAPGAVVGALSAGRVGYFAADQHVVNLDGLVNDRRYLDEVLRPGRFAEYFTEREIEWFADLAPREAWRSGVSWAGGNLPASRLAPRRYWRMPDGSAYGIWQVLAPAAAFELLGPEGPPVRDLAVELAVAADVHGRYPVVREADLPAHPDRVVALSIPQGAPLELLHVLTTRDELAAIGLTAATVWPEHRHGSEVAPGLTVLGHGVDEVRNGARRQFAVTLYWRREREVGDAAIRVEVASAAARATVAAGDCHGTLPWSRWPVGGVVVETVAVEVDDASCRPPRVGVAVGHGATRWLTR